MDIFDKYLNNEMVGKEAEEFELLLSNDESLEKEFLLYKELLSHSNKRENVNHALNVLAEIHREKISSSEKVVKIAKKWPWLLFITLILSACLYYYFKSIKKNEPKELYAMYYSKPRISLIEKTGVVDNGLAKISNYYDKAQYQKLLNFEQDLNISKNDASAQLLLMTAISEMELNKLNEAKNTLNLLSKKFSVYNNQALFYQALIAIKEDKKNEAKQYLIQIDTTSAFFEKSNVVLEKLR